MKRTRSAALGVAIVLSLTRARNLVDHSDHDHSDHDHSDHDH